MFSFEDFDFLVRYNQSQSLRGSRRALGTPSLVRETWRIEGSSSCLQARAGNRGAAKSSPRLNEFKVFASRRVILDTQDLPQEAPREEKQRLRRRSNEKSREEGQQEHPRGTQDGSLAPEKLPRDPQEHPRGAQEAPKSAQKRPKRAPRRSQDHLRIEHNDLFKKRAPA